MNKQTNTTNNGKRPHYSIYKPVDPVNGEKQKWPRVGVAFKNRDGSLNLIFNEDIAASTRLQVRAFQSKEKA